MRNKLKSMIRITSFALTLVIFLMTAGSTYAWAVQPDLQAAEQEVHYSYDRSTNDESPKRTKRIVPALPWIGMGIGELITWLTAGAAVAVITYEAGEWASVFDVSKELDASKKKDKPKFFVAKTIYGNKTPLQIGKPLGEGEAEAYLKASIHNDVWTPNEERCQRSSDETWAR